MLGALAGITAALQLASADVRITIDADSAVVNATYETRGTSDSLRFTIIRLRGQTLAVPIPQPDSQPVAVRELDGLTWVIITSTSGSPHTAHLRYTVTGDLSRIPIAVPDVATEPAASRVVVRVVGWSATASLDETFPRFIREVDGSAVAHPANLPNFVRIPPERGRWTVSRLVQWFVVVLFAFTSFVWVARARQRAGLRSA